MHADYAELVERRFRALPEKGPDKRTALEHAIADHVRPGDSVHMASTLNRPYGLGWGLLRRFWNEEPGLEISCLNIGEGWIPLFATRIMQRAVTTYAGDVWPYPSPNPLVTDAWLSGRVAIEHWSILSFVQRLLAGALRLPFVPTRSLVGSTMAEENEAFRLIDDPFGSGSKVGAVAPYRPDWCFIHVPACDAAGNAAIAAPYGEGPLGAYAAKKGTIVSTEKIVSTEYLRRHNDVVRIPGHLVRAVVELPFGALPRGQPVVGLSELEDYADDYAFQYELRHAGRGGEQAMRDWIERWVLGPKTHEGFLEALGRPRLERLRDRAKADAWSRELDDIVRGVEGEAGKAGELDASVDTYRASEMMVAAASRKIVRVARERDLHTILAGIGAANLAAWLATYQLRDAEHAIESMAEVGYFGYEPRPADPYVFGYRNLATCLSVTDILTVLGFNVGSGGNLGSLGAGQIDRFGNLNTTCIPGKLHLLGSGGGNDVASASAACVVTAYLGKEKFKERVDYVTSPGETVKVVVTDHGVLEKPLGRHPLRLVGYYADGPTGAADAESAARKIRSEVGWDLEVADELEAIGPPTKEELLTMRAFDPYRQFIR